jgi:HD-like signal output (HDOD) protein
LETKSKNMSTGNTPTLDLFFSNVKLPALSEVAQALIKTLDDDSASPSEVRNIIAQDPALCARLLRLANSAHFGLPRGVGTLDDAISMVGMSQIRNMSLGALMNDAFPLVPGLDQAEFRRSSKACAGYAQWLAGCLNMDGQTAWLAGMMLRLGELLIIQVAPDTLLEIEQQPNLSGFRWEREQRLVGFTEGQIMGQLALKWNFPMQIMQALQRAAEPLTEQAYSRLGAVLHLASCLADTPDAGPQALDALPPEVLNHLSLDLAGLRQRFPAPNGFTPLSAD